MTSTAANIEGANAYYGDEDKLEGKTEADRTSATAFITTVRLKEGVQSATLDTIYWKVTSEAGKNINGEGATVPETRYLFPYRNYQPGRLELIQEKPGYEDVQKYSLTRITIENGGFAQFYVVVNNLYDTNAQAEAIPF